MDIKIRKLRAVVVWIVVAAMLFLTGCNDAETPEQAIRSFNSKMNDCEYKAAFAYVQDYDGLSFDKGDKNGTRQIVDAVAKTLKIEIIDIQTAGATGAATLNIQTVDLRAVYGKAAATVTNGYVDTVLGGAKISAEQMRDALVAEIVHEAALSDAEKAVTECTVNLSKKKDHWYIILDTTSFNIIMGYINDANTMVENGDFTSFAAVTVSDSDANSVESNTGEDDNNGEDITFND